MFKDSQEGQTHSFNDGCGELEHNKWTIDFDKFIKLANEIKELTKKEQCRCNCHS